MPTDFSVRIDSEASWFLREHAFRVVGRVFARSPGDALIGAQLQLAWRVVTGVAHDASVLND